MKALKFSTILLGATLFLGLSATTLNAGMKCGAGKCGAAMMKADKKLNGCECKDCDNKKCAAKLDSKAKCDCNHKKPVMKCGAGKCGGNK